MGAIEHCNDALRYDPSHVKAAYRGATAAIEVGMRDVAISFLDNALVESPDSQDLLEMRSKLGPLPEGPAPAPPGGADNDEDDVKISRWSDRQWAPPPKAPPPPPDKK